MVRSQTSTLPLASRQVHHGVVIPSVVHPTSCVPLVCLPILHSKPSPIMYPRASNDMPHSLCVALMTITVHSSSSPVHCSDTLQSISLTCSVTAVLIAHNCLPGSTYRYVNLQWGERNVLLMGTDTLLEHTPCGTRILYVRAPHLNQPARAQAVDVSSRLHSQGWPRLSGPDPETLTATHPSRCSEVPGMASRDGHESRISSAVVSRNHESRPSRTKARCQGFCRPVPNVKGGREVVARDSLVTRVRTTRGPGFVLLIGVDETRWT